MEEVIEYINSLIKSFNEKIEYAQKELDRLNKEEVYLGKTIEEFKHYIIAMEYEVSYLILLRQKRTLSNITGIVTYTISPEGYRSLFFAKVLERYEDALKFNINNIDARVKSDLVRCYGSIIEKLLKYTSKH